MHIKASLHLHTAEDAKEGRIIHYTIYQLIDRAEKLNFRVLALTCHEHFIFKTEFADYARARGIILLPGVEAEIADETGKTSHTLIINCDEAVRRVKTFTDLANYRHAHPQCLVIAPHPFGARSVSLQENLERHIDLFDAIEHSWFYAPGYNLNKKAWALAHRHHLPMIATSDLHSFNTPCFNTNYCHLTVNNFSVAGVVEAVKRGRIDNVARHQSWPWFIWRLTRTVIDILRLHAWKFYDGLFKNW